MNLNKILNNLIIMNLGILFKTREILMDCLEFIIDNVSYRSWYHGANCEKGAGIGHHFSIENSGCHCYNMPV